MQIKAKKRQIVKPLSDFIEPEDDQENDQEERRVNEREKERERERERQENYKENGLLLVDEDLEVREFLCSLSLSLSLSSPL